MNKDLAKAKDNEAMGDFGGMKSEEQTSSPSQKRVIIGKEGLEQESFLHPGLGNIILDLHVASWS